MSLMLCTSILLNTEIYASECERIGETTSEVRKLVCKTATSLSNIQEITDGNGYQPLPYERTIPVYRPKVELYSSGEIESSYMTDISEVVSTYPVTRDQGSFGTCWAISATTLAEFGMQKKGYVTKSANYSELQHAYYTYHNLTDPLGGTDGDCNSYRVPDAYKHKEAGLCDYLDLGGNVFLSMRTYLTWCGAVEEEELPYTYETAMTMLDEGVDSTLAYEKTQAMLKNAYIISTDPADGQLDAIKAAIKEFGAVTIAYFADDLGVYGQAITNANGEEVFTYYYPEVESSNHQVCVVGWDDNFSKELFKVAPGKRGPQYDGAWLVRNSWSNQPPQADGCTYFWLSYYDCGIESAAYAFDFTTRETYDNNYQYDGGYFTAEVKECSAAANIFTAQDSENGETLKAVMISQTERAGVSYTISVYKDLEDDDNPTSGECVYEQSGTTTLAGSYTVDLENPVELYPGETFAVVVEVDSGAYDVEVDYDCADYSGDIFSEPFGYYTDVTASGKSFLLQSGGWQNSNELYSNIGDACIKAFTVNRTEPLPERYQVTYELNGGTNHTNNPRRYIEGADAVSLEAPTRDGYQFEGWYRDEAYTQKVTTIGGDSTGDITLYARWIPISYLITYELDGGTNHSGNPANYTIEDEVVLQNPSRSGYSFEGWFYDIYFTNRFLGITKGSFGDITLYAKWSAIETEDETPGQTTPSNEQNTSNNTSQNNVSSSAETKPTDTEKKGLEVGQTFTDASIGATFKVAKIGENGIPELVYLRSAKTKAASIVVPDFVIKDGVKCKITAIGAKAFRNCSKLKSVKLGKNISVIEKNAFSNCKKLTLIMILSSKMKSASITKGAFKGVTSQTVIKVPKKKVIAYTKLFRNKGLSKKVTIKSK